MKDYVKYKDLIDRYSIEIEDDSKEKDLKRSKFIIEFKTINKVYLKDNSFYIHLDHTPGFKFLVFDEMDEKISNEIKNSDKVDANNNSKFLENFMLFRSIKNELYNLIFTDMVIACSIKQSKDFIKLKNKFLSLELIEKDYRVYDETIHNIDKSIKLDYSQIDNHIFNTLKDDVISYKISMGIYYNLLALVSEKKISLENLFPFFILLTKEIKYLNGNKLHFLDEVLQEICSETIIISNSIEKYSGNQKRQNEIHTKFTGSSLMKKILKGIDDKVNSNKKKDEIIDNLVDCIKINITPVKINYLKRHKDYSNRIYRRYLSTSLNGLKCQFKSEIKEKSSYKCGIYKLYQRFIMKNGISINDKKFFFFGYSNSQFKEGGFFSITINPVELIQRIGDFSEIKTVSKYGSRIGLCLTSTIDGSLINSNNVNEIKDITYNKKTFSDGVSRMNKSLGELLSKRLNLSYVPSSFQGRFLGCKGVWIVIQNEDLDKLKLDENQKKKFLSKDPYIEIRPSQKKFKFNKEFEGEPFEICDYSKPIECYLNRQILLLLRTIGISQDNILKRTDDYLREIGEDKSLANLIINPITTKLLNRMMKLNLSSKNNDFLNDILLSNRDILFDNLKNKSHVFIDEAIYVMGVMDEFGILEEGECFLKIDKNLQENFVNQVYNENNVLIVSGKSIVTKCPCHHPGDLRVMNFKRYSKSNSETKKYEVFEKYSNTLFFSQKGQRPDPDKMAGSDLDGDCYFVIYDKEILKNIDEIENNEPANTVPGIVLDKENIKRTDVIDFYVNFSSNDNLGTFCNTHLSICDENTSLICKDEKALELCNKIAICLDSVKTGEFPELLKEEKDRRKPHYMSKIKNFDLKKYFRSQSIISMIHEKREKKLNDLRNANKKFNDRSKLIDIKLFGFSNYLTFNINQIMKIEKDENIEYIQVFIFESLYLYSIYCKELNGILEEYGFDYEHMILCCSQDKINSKNVIGSNFSDNKQIVIDKFKLFIKGINKYSQNIMWILNELFFSSESEKKTIFKKEHQSNKDFLRFGNNLCQDIYILRIISNFIIQSNVEKISLQIIDESKVKYQNFLLESFDNFNQKQNIGNFLNYYDDILNNDSFNNSSEKEIKIIAKIEYMKKEIQNFIQNKGYLSYSKNIEESIGLADKNKRKIKSFSWLYSDSTIAPSLFIKFKEKPL